MKNIIINKLKSRSGASITYALLLFLVCAVVGSVVLIAGTAASGRLSRLPEMDQRYYSVTSAAGIIRDSFDGRSATIAERAVRVDRGTAVYIDGGSSPVQTDTVTGGETAAEGYPRREGGSLLLSAAEAYAGEVKNLTLSLSEAEGIESADAGLLAVNVKMQTADDGTLTVTVSNAGGGDVYTLALVFTLQKDVSETESTVPGEQSSKEERYTEDGTTFHRRTTIITETETVKTTTTTYRWSLKEIKRTEG